MKEGRQGVTADLFVFFASFLFSRVSVSQSVYLVVSH
jgi:hypothetical protein